METRRIGSLNVSVVGLGCNNFGARLDAAATARVVHAALDSGINFLDTADIYGATASEEFLGRAIEGRRAEVVLATKFGKRVDEQRQGAHPDYIRLAVQDSMRRLGTDYIDLYQLHSPDPNVPLADTLGALDDLVRAGQVREIGCSNFTVDQLREAEAAAGGGARFVSVQNEYSLLHREPEGGMLRECARTGLAFLPYYPLASGLLTGKYRKGAPVPAGSRLEGRQGYGLFTDDNLELVERLLAFAGDHGHTLLELAFSWLLGSDAVASVIAGATRVDQLRANAAAAGWRLTGAERAGVEALLAE